MVAKENEKDPWKMLPPASEESCDKTSVNMHVNEEPLPSKHYMINSAIIIFYETYEIAVC